MKMILTYGEMRILPNNGGIECSLSYLIGRIGSISVRACCNGQWFDIFLNDFEHVKGTANLAEAWYWLVSELIFPR